MLALIGFLCAAVFFCGFLYAKNTQKAEALDSSTINSATKIGNGDSSWDKNDDLWDSTNKDFNWTVALSLTQTLFGNTNAVTYIKNNADTTEKTTYSGATVVPASVINGSNNYGYLVKLGGLDWMITSLTFGGYNETTKKEGEVPVLTLMLADNLTNSSNVAITSQYYSDATHTKGNNAYCHSILRNNVLSGTGEGYSKLALFTDTSKGSFAKNYLVQPKSIYYQRQQTMKGRSSEIGDWNNPNDALETPTNGAWSVSDPYVPENEFDGIRYDEWGNDYIWLPSLTETGAGNGMSTTCIWKLSTEQRCHSSSTPSWWRSTYFGQYYGLVYKIGSNGDFVHGNAYTNQEFTVRPAIHLNLEPLLGLQKPQDVETPYIYNGKEQKPTDQNWYRSDVFDNPNLCEVTYKKGGVVITSPKEVGTYEVSFKLLDTENYVWVGDKENDTQTMTYTIDPKELKLKFPTDNDYSKITFSDDPDYAPCAEDMAPVNKVPITLTYKDSSGNELAGPPKHKGTSYSVTASISNPNYILTGKISETFDIDALRVKAYFMSPSVRYNGAERTFNLILTGDDEDNPATITLLEDYAGVVQDPNNPKKFTARNVGKYYVNLHLGNTEDYVWDSTGKDEDLKLFFEITPYTITLTIPSISPAGGVTEGYKAYANVETTEGLKSTDTLTVLLGAYYDGDFIDYLCAIDLDNELLADEFELDTTLLSAGTYTLGVLYDDPNDVNAKNYNVVLAQSYSFTVKEPSESGGLIWRLMQGSKLVTSQADPADTNTAKFSKTITYNGQSFTFVVNAKELGTVDTSYNSNGFINGYKTVAKGKNLSLTTVTDAGDYITTVHLKNTEGETDEYSIEWTISKVKFDLSGVRWLYDGKIQYNEGGMTIELDPDTVPEGLTATVKSVTPVTVGQKGTATVTFKVSDTKNYELPVSTNKNSYTFKPSEDLTDFEWTKEWEVVPAVIPVDWTLGMITVNGKKVSVETLAGNYNSYVNYVYYETDSMGNKLDPDAEGLKEPVIVDGVAKYYVAEVSIKPSFEGKYVLDPEAEGYLSPVFEAGKNITVVEVAPKKTSYPYTGLPVEFEFEVTQGTIVESAFEIVYYKGMLKQANPPKDVGTYRAQIKLKSEYERDYYIDGDTAFEYVIEKAVIKIDWDNGLKPPSLKRLTDTEKLVITYEYSDENGDTVSIGTMRTTAGTYRVRAVIKSASQKNYIFDNDLAETEWVSFEITEEDIRNGMIVDPNDPEGNKLYVDFSLKNSSGAKGVVPQITNTAGLILGADYSVEYLKDGVPVSNFSAAGKYEIKITLLGENAENYILISDNLEYTVLENGGEGNGNNTQNPGGDGTGNNPSNRTIEDILPIILSGISLVLIIVFLIMTLNNLSAAKEAREKTKKLATITYSFAPASLMMLFGLSYTNWWIVAGVLMGLALIMGIVAFTSKNKKKRAFAMLEEEQARIAEEKEIAQREEMREEQARIREEQARRDNEMRMMFAAMQQNYGQPQGQGQLIDYDVLQNMINSSVQALLPGLQQLQALPPASPDASAYSNPEADALREQLAAQEERMAQQQELLNRILQNQENYVMPLYEEEIEDDISWLGESDEVISLEESYGALSDEGKRAYYEVGSYIMNKPRTSQNDGRYAVLFKYRGKTLFKLAIKDDAPVLYYPSGSGRSEVRISDSSSLELAKSVIDRQTVRTDNELN